MSFSVLISLFAISDCALYDHSRLDFTRLNGPIWDRVIEPQIGKNQNLFFGNPRANVTIIRSLTGIAIFDYDHDGDLDIFLSQGRGEHHTLFENQFDTQGQAVFVDKGVALGFGSTVSIQQDGSGVCFGDINNDGYSDLLVLGRHDKNLMYINVDDGGSSRKFQHVPNNGIDDTGNDYGAVGCSFGDIDNDGLIDVVIANSHQDIDDWLTIRNSGSLRFYQPNELFRNLGNNQFEDLTARIIDTKFGDPGQSHPNDGNNTLTWGIVLADINSDGYPDIIMVDDDLSRPSDDASLEQERGIIHVFLNDQSGFFSDVPVRQEGGFMGIEIADLNCDDKMDMFVSNEGAYQLAFKGFPQGNGVGSSIFVFGDDQGGFPDYVSQFSNFKTPFGWGCAIMDYDNDGDLDVVMHGGLDLSFFKISDNPGVLYENKDGCMGNWEVKSEGVFELDSNCNYPKCGVHHQRDVHGLAIGDLNNDGFLDIVTSSTVNYDLDLIQPINISQRITIPPGGIVDPVELDQTALFFNGYFTFPLATGGWYNWTGPKPKEGDVRLDMAIPNGNNFFHVTVKGGIGIVTSGVVNSDCIGCIIKFIADDQSSIHVSIPILGGSSHVSQHSLRKVFGLGSESKGDRLEIRYPTGQGSGYVTNVLDDIKKDEMLTLYEIPCDYVTRASNTGYCVCVTTAVSELENQGKISKKLRERLTESMDCEDSSSSSSSSDSSIGGAHVRIGGTSGTTNALLGLNVHKNLSDSGKTSIVLVLTLVISVLINLFVCGYCLLKSLFLNQKRRPKQMYDVVSTISSSDEELSD